MAPHPQFQERWLPNENCKPWLASVTDSKAKAYYKRKTRCRLQTETVKALIALVRLNARWLLQVRTG